MSPDYSIEQVRIEYTLERMKQEAVRVELRSKSIRNALLWYLELIQVERTYFLSALLVFWNLQFAFEIIDILNLLMPHIDVAEWTLQYSTSGLNGGIQKWKKDPKIHSSYSLIAAVVIFLLKIFQE